MVLPSLQKGLEVPPSQFIIGAKKEGDDDGGDLDDDAQVCSCHVRCFLSFSFLSLFIDRSEIRKLERIERRHCQMRQRRRLTIYTRYLVRME